MNESLIIKRVGNRCTIYEKVMYLNCKVEPKVDVIIAVNTKQRHLSRGHGPSPV